MIPVRRFDFMTVSIRNFHDSGNFSLLPSPLAILAASWTGSDITSLPPPSADLQPTHLDESGLPEIITAICPLREVLGDDDYESLARPGRP